MKLFLKLFLMVAVVFTAGCYSAEKKTAKDEKKEDRTKFVAGALCPSRANEDKWRKQSIDQMRNTKKIPSVDFEFDSFVLEPSAYEVLDKVAAIMTSDRSYKLIVEGHTDIVGSYEYNDWLSNARSNAIKSYLISRGVNSESVKTYGHGKRRPLTKDISPEGRACNRRVEFTLTTRTWASVY